MSSPAVHIGICPVWAVVARLAPNRTGPDRGGHRDPPVHSRRQQLAVPGRLDGGEPPDPGGGYRDHGPDLPMYLRGPRRALAGRDSTGPHVTSAGGTPRLGVSPARARRRAMILVTG